MHFKRDWKIYAWGAVFTIAVIYAVKKYGAGKPLVGHIASTI